MGKRGMRRTLAGIVLAAGLLFVPSASAVADTAVMGSTLTGTFDGGVSGAPVLSVQLSYDPAMSPNPVVAPADGTITGWKVKSADTGPSHAEDPAAERAGQPPNRHRQQLHGSCIRAGPVRRASRDRRHHADGRDLLLPASLPISKGDYVGVALGGAADGLPQAFTNGVTQNLIANNFAGQPADGSAADLLADEQHDLLLQATIEFTPLGSPAGTPGTAKKKCKKKKKHRAADAKKKKCKKKK